MPPVERKRRKGGRAGRLANVPFADTLVEKGSPNFTKPPASDRVCVIACGALAHEILDVIEANGLEHIALTCLPAKLHNAPEKISDAVARAILDARQAGFGEVFCAYADCGTGGMLDRVLETHGVARLPGAHCYAFFSGVEEFSAREEKDMRAFFLTDFLARHFDGLTWKPLGLDVHPELVETYFGHYEKVVFLSQTHDEALTERARAIARRLNLNFEHRRTGYGDLEATLTNI